MYPHVTQFETRERLVREHLHQLRKRDAVAAAQHAPPWARRLFRGRVLPRTRTALPDSARVREAAS